MAVRFGTPPGVVIQEELESAQKCVARFVTANYSYEMEIPQEKEERQ